MKITGNEPVNPGKELSSEGAFVTNNGLTMRQYYAGLAMQGILSDQTFVRPNEHDTIAKLAVDLADSLITELNK